MITQPVPGLLFASNPIVYYNSSILILDETSEFFPGSIEQQCVLILDVRQPIFVVGLFLLNLSSEIS